MLMCRNLWSAPIWLVTGLAALGVAAASCGGSEPGPAGEVGPTVQVAQSPLIDETVCLNGTVPDAMAGIRRAKGVLVKPRSAGDGATDFSWLNDHALSGC